VGSILKLPFIYYLRKFAVKAIIKSIDVTFWFI